MTGRHLTDEQFTELLAGDYPFDASRHLHECAQCRWEFNQVQASIADFGSFAIEWAEQRASVSIPAPSAFARAWQPRSAWAAAAVLAAAVLFGLHQEKRIQPPGAITVANIHPAHSEQEVAEDNQLMMAIDKEIHWQAESPVAGDSLVESGRRPHSQAPGRLAN
jgi:hypothetical protein